MTLNFSLIGVSAAMLALATVSASAADYPTRSVTLVVPFNAGGGADNTARVLARGMEAATGQSFVVENRGGASGSIGANYVAKAKPDGYTVLFDASSFSLNPVLRKLPYNAKEDFIPVSQAVVVPNILVVSPQSPYNTLSDFIEAAQSAPGQHTYASYGPGSLAQMAGELLQKQTGVELMHIPYTGGAPAIVDVMGGHVEAYFANAASSLNYVSSGDLRALAVTSDERMPELPDVPTVVESGIDEFSVYEWNGLFVPKGTPEPIVKQLEQIVQEALEQPEIVRNLRALGQTPVGNTSEEFSEFLQSEENRWLEVVKANNISLD